MAGIAHGSGDGNPGVFANRSSSRPGFYASHDARADFGTVNCDDGQGWLYRWGWKTLKRVTGHKLGGLMTGKTDVACDRNVALQGTMTLASRTGADFRCKISDRTNLRKPVQLSDLIVCANGPEI